MKLLIDTTFLFDQYSRRGIGRYAREVFKRTIELALDEKSEVVLVGFNTLEQNLIQFGFSQFSIDKLVSDANLTFKTLGKTELSSTKNLVTWFSTFRPIINEVRADIYLAPHFERGLPSHDFLRLFLNTYPKTVVATHDVIPLALNKFSQKGDLQNFLKGAFYKFMFRGVQHSDLVLTCSDYSKNDLISFGHIDQKKIRRIYLGIDKSFYRENSVDESISNTLKTFDLESKKYVLYDAGLEANKGIDKLIAMFKNIVAKQNEDLPKYLVITGRDFGKGTGKSIKGKTELGDKYLRIFKREGILENIVTTDKVEEEDLTNLFFATSCYLNLSIYEGFSFGPLQAMAAEVPSIASNTSCTPEVTAGGAFLVDTIDISKASEDVINYIQDKKEVASKIKIGKEVVQRYDWDKTAEETWKEIKALVN